MQESPGGQASGVKLGKDTAGVQTNREQTWVTHLLFTWAKKKKKAKPDQK